MPHRAAANAHHLSLTLIFHIRLTTGAIFHWAAFSLQLLIFIDYIISHGPLLAHLRIRMLFTPFLAASFSSLFRLLMLLTHSAGWRAGLDARFTASLICTISPAFACKAAISPPMLYTAESLPLCNTISIARDDFLANSYYSRHRAWFII